MALTQVQGGMILPSTTLTTPIVATTMGVGGATPAASGSGITFPATQSASTDANTLDDYEEGTWTPQAGSEDGAYTATYSQQAGRYVKIGNRVWATFDLILASRTLTGSIAFLRNLPFSVANNGDLSGSFGNFAIITSGGVNFTYITLYAQNAANYCYIQYTAGSTATTSPIANSFWGPVTRVAGGVMYNTAS